MPNTDNLISIGDRTPEEKAAIAAKAAEARARNRVKNSEKTDFRNLCRKILTMDVNSKEKLEVSENTNLSMFKGRNTDVMTRMTLQIAVQAMDGDLPSASFLVKNAGWEAPKEENVNINAPIILDDMADWDDEEDLSKESQDEIFDKVREKRELQDIETVEVIGEGE